MKITEHARQNVPMEPPILQKNHNEVLWKVTKNALWAVDESPQGINLPDSNGVLRLSSEDLFLTHEAQRDYLDPLVFKLYLTNALTYRKVKLGIPSNEYLAQMWVKC